MSLLCSYMQQMAIEFCYFSYLSVGEKGELQDSQGKESILFDALTQFMKKSALHTANEIVRYVISINLRYISYIYEIITTKSNLSFKLEMLLVVYIILSSDVPLLRSDFYSRPEFLVDLLVDIFRVAEKGNPQRYTFSYHFSEKKVRFPGS